ncbi:hypothetical protein FRC06_003130 [Ceratobasidium sp. 370]|nr:hypothetical protein FRC06_003130 [Ceratobasidium sp. 370]
MLVQQADHACKSTGGKAPRKQLAMKQACRRARPFAPTHGLQHGALQQVDRAQVDQRQGAPQAARRAGMQDACWFVVPSNLHAMLTPTRRGQPVEGGNLAAI